MSELFIGPDGQPRCAWCAADDLYIAYHDFEWGFPVDDDVRLFEKICLESFQSGLSWRTILIKREHFRNAFHHFDFNRVAQFTEKDVERLLQDEGIVRHRGKIEATINNAKRAVEMVEKKVLSPLLLALRARNPPGPQTVSTTEESTQLSKDLKKLGWKFVGPTTVYAFMQAMGLVNDHYHGCFIREKVIEARKNFKKP